MRMLLFGKAGTQMPLLTAFSSHDNSENITVAQHLHHNFFMHNSSSDSARWVSEELTAFIGYCRINLHYAGHSQGHFNRKFGTNTVKALSILMLAPVRHEACRIAEIATRFQQF